MSESTRHAWARWLPYLLILIMTFLESGLRIVLAPVGVVWDEPYYLYAGGCYVGLHDDTLSESGHTRWQVNHEHPPLGKLLIGAGEIAGITISPSARGMLIGGRLAVAAGYAMALAGIFALARPLGTTVAWTAVFLVMACPRFVGHGEIATIDMPLTAVWIWTLALAARAVTTDGALQWQWTLATCLMGGLAMLSKFSGILLPGMVFVWLAWRRWIGTRLLSDHACRPPKTAFFLPVLMGVVGCFVLIAGWPWLWTDPIQRLAGYITKSLDHKMAPVLYFGTVYGADFGRDAPPWHYAPVMIMLTTPVLVTLGLVMAAVWRGRQLATHTVATLAICGGVILPLITMLPGAVVYDGVRIFLPAIPLLCIPAAIGLQAGLARYTKCLPVVLAVLMLAFSRMAVSNNLSYYNMACGGPSGARALGMEPCYWATGLGLRPIQDRLIHNQVPSKVALIGLGEFTGPLLKDLGVLPKDTKIMPIDGSWNMAIVPERLSLADTRTILTMLQRGEVQDVLTTESRVWPFTGSPILRIVVRPQQEGRK